MSPRAAIYLGMISGTSADGIDAALVSFDPAIEVLAASMTPYPAEIRARLLALTTPSATISLDEFGALDVAVGHCFADAACALLAEHGQVAGSVRAIGSHGQTVRHRPAGMHPFSLQIGDASVIAERTGIETVSDFRRADIAAGGQGAPLAPAFHAALLVDRAPCAILNLGGIANLSLIDEWGGVLGFDTGPANCLLDAWHERHFGTACDLDGRWASRGTVDEGVLSSLLEDPYFTAMTPKSTGREQFNLAWLQPFLASKAREPADVQATLLALSARAIADSLRVSGFAGSNVYACGGGVHNAALMAAIAHAINPLRIASTLAIGVDPDYVEAALFAWLARERVEGRPGNRVDVTGARGSRLLGAIHAAPR
ncbi:MAG: anhydro-N-acetylmuramic acid kinase [Dokdonella sp.]